MLPVSAWPPGPPGSSLSPFGRPREIRVCDHARGFVIPKGAWIVTTGSNRVIMFRPPVRHDNPPRTPGTGLLPGSIPPRPLPPVPPCPPPPAVYRVRAKLDWRKGGEPFSGPSVGSVVSSIGAAAMSSPAGMRANSGSAGAVATAAQSSITTAQASDRRCWPPAPIRPRFVRFDDYLEAWRAWQRAIGRTDPPNRPLPGRRPPNWFGWAFDRCAPGSTIVPMNSAGTVLADGQNVVIAGAGFATIVQAYSV